MHAQYENRRSVQGSDNRKGGRGSESVARIEGHVGSSGSGGVRFKMPENVVDHSKVRSTIGRE